MVKISMPGMWHCRIVRNSNEEQEGVLRLPGTLDESGIGFPETKAQPWHPDAKLLESKEDRIISRFTRVVTFEGCAKLDAQMMWTKPDNCRVFLDVERARCLRLWVNGQEIPPCRPFSLSAPQCFEVTDAVKGFDRFEIHSDNSYPGLPHDDIVFSSAATDETQTNWNGLLGNFSLRMENPVFLEAIRVYPHEHAADVCVTVNAACPWKGKVYLYSPAFAGTETLEIDMDPGTQTFRLEGISYAPDVKRWDLNEGNLYTVTASADGLDTLTADFGVRTFAAKDGFFTLNGRRIFLRAEANCAVFPETGHPPMDVEEWIRILKTYQAYGVNCMRFHSHTPPEAAFTAADRLGMLMQPELPCWNPRNAFETADRSEFYSQELEQILLFLANHPSFVLLTFGNELHAGEEGHRKMSEMLAFARRMDPTRLYANASNPHYGSLGCDPDSDFYTSQRFEKLPMRGSFAGMHGHINEAYPNAQTNYRPAMEALRKTYAGPVIAFEVGQFEVLPDFDEIRSFAGVTRAANYEAIRDKAEKAGMLPEWKQYVAATAALSRLCYREEVEANLRTGSLAGISLLGLQDFPGQGTALVGMLNSHLQPKPYMDTQPESFRSFFRDETILVLLPRYTYECGEKLEADVLLANYGKADLQGSLVWTMETSDRVLQSGRLDAATVPHGGLGTVGRICCDFPVMQEAAALSLHLAFGECRQQYSLWLYPKIHPVCPAEIYETDTWNETAERVLEDGGRVYYTPGVTDDMPNTIRTQFSTDFWSVGTFPQQPGGMGQLIDVRHPIFKNFPTQPHTDWQWWPMAVSRAWILEGKLAGTRPIIRELDSYAYMRHMAQLLEFRVGKGRLVMSSMGLKELCEQYPEARALQNAIYTYMTDPSFLPPQEAALEDIRKLILG